MSYEPLALSQQISVIGGSLLSQVSQKLSRLVVKPWKHLIQSLIAEVLIYGLAQHAAEVRGEREVAAFVEL